VNNIEKELLNFIIYKGHFLLSSGLHSDTYIQCAKLLERPALLEKMCVTLAEKIKNDIVPDVVVSPAFGGLFVGYEIAKYFNKPFIFAERNREGFLKIKRGFKINKKDYKILIVDDVLTTGKSILETKAIITKNTGEDLDFYYAVLFNRGVDKFKYDYYCFSDLVKTYKMLTFVKDECSLCKKGIPLTKPGSR